MNSFLGKRKTLESEIFDRCNNIFILTTIFVGFNSLLVAESTHKL